MKTLSVTEVSRNFSAVLDSVERRKEDRRSAERDETMRLTGWVQVDPS